MARVAERTQAGRTGERVCLGSERSPASASMLYREHCIRSSDAAVLRFLEQRKSADIGVGEVDTAWCPLRNASGVGAQKTDRRAYHRMPETYDIYVRDASPDVRVRHRQLHHYSFHPIVPGGCLQHPTFDVRVTCCERTIVGPYRRTPFPRTQRLVSR